MPRVALSRRTRGLIAVPVILVLTGCIHNFWRTVAVKVALPESGSVVVKTPLKVHMVDGRTVVFRTGASIDRSAITGSGESYGMLASISDPRAVSRVTLDSVVGVETFEGRRLAAQTFIVSAAATAVTGAATILLLKALFGSCPTVYADTGVGTEPVLQAEGFSYAIAPLLEQRDLDPLRVRPDSNGLIRLDLRNEALETHYINNIELLAVRHARDARAVPDQNGRPVVVSAIRSIAAAHDRSGRDVRAVLAASDGDLFSSSAHAVNGARVGDLDDWIDLDVRDLRPGDSIAVVLRLRNSLLNTVLLYDGILSGRDAPDWLDTGLQHIATAIDLGAWYTRTMGMRVSVEGVRPKSQDQPWNARLSDVGPLAFRDVAIVLPRPAHIDSTVRVRLRFVADDWRIDYATVAAHIGRPSPVMIPLRRVVVPTPVGAKGPIVDTAAVAALREPDGKYLQTMPGQRMTLEFAPNQRAEQPDSTTTYMIAWQGWYREWIRGQWLAEPKRSVAWTPGDSSVLAALRQWHSRKNEMEQAFYSTRIPVK